MLFKVEICPEEVNLGWILSKLGIFVPENCFLLTALLLDSLAITFTGVNSFLKKKNHKKLPKISTAVKPLNFLAHPLFP